ncbi:mitochondrial carrier [Basidiobolus meristosporus CBS 931.73]|uniref:Mitochondrial carrier n=1 Tax=Basidiobolus meristosporus CBS 931.73 TaxID=1314790 RepID=A0A1Y1YVD3_9FUNG|nr:mitochondrial carrier [Basidiobolus meristosporus CBS 931.73]|eukprot:ORY02003.1 mitochondrial carrier [Basidiobolus meristosporus CBS 931.73]
MSTVVGDKADRLDPGNSSQEKVQKLSANVESEPSAPIPTFLEESESEKDARIRKLFNFFDVDNKGVLDVVAIINALDAVTSSPIRMEYAQQLLLRCDTSHDDLIQYEEFRAFVEEKEMELWKLFSEIDRNNDNELQKCEIEGALKKANIHISKDELDTFFNKMDKDNNGVIDFDEWRDFLLLLPRETTIYEIWHYHQAIAHVSMDGEIVVSGKGNSLSAFFAGAIAGAVSRTATAPLDRLKVFLQTQTKGPVLAMPKNLSETNIAKKRVILGLYHRVKSAATTIADTMRQIYRNGGVSSFFRGNGLNVAKIIPESAIKFYTYDKVKKYLAKYLNEEEKTSSSISMRFVAGGAAGLTSQFSIYPVEVLKTRIMSSAGMSKSSTKGVLKSTATKMWKTGGLTSFYKGLTPALIGVMPYAAIDMGLFETLRVTYTKYLQSISKNEDEAPSVLALLGCGTISGTVGATSVYPLNLVRTRLMAQGTPGHPYTYDGVMDVVKRTYTREGITGFYRGLVPTLIKVIPAVSISYVVYEKTRRFIDSNE